MLVLFVLVFLININTNKVLILIKILNTNTNKISVLCFLSVISIINFTNNNKIVHPNSNKYQNYIIIMIINFIKSNSIYIGITYAYY